MIASPQLRPVRIAAGAFGPATPARDLVVSQLHRFLVRSPKMEIAFGFAEGLATARALTGRDGVAETMPPEGCAYYHLALDEHDLVCAEGVWAESLMLGPIANSTLTEQSREELEEIFPAAEGKGPRTACAPVLRRYEVQSMIDLELAKPAQADREAV
jgi:hypothetical protein